MKEELKKSFIINALTKYYNMEETFTNKEPISSDEYDKCYEYLTYWTFHFANAVLCDLGKEDARKLAKAILAVTDEA